MNVALGLGFRGSSLAGLDVRRWRRRLGVSRLGRRWGLRAFGGNLTSLEVFEILPSFQVQGRYVTSVEGRVFTSLQVGLEELASLEVDINLTSLDIVLGLTGKGGSKCGSTEESDSKESDFRSVLHDDLIIRSL
jgi:hypothetical protein